MRLTTATPPDCGGAARWRRLPGWQSLVYRAMAGRRATWDRPVCSPPAWRASGLALLGGNGRERFRRSPQARSRTVHGSSRSALLLGAVGAGDREARSVAAPVLRDTAVVARGLYRRLATPCREHGALAHAARHRVRGRRGARVHQRRGDRMVARHRLLVASGAPLHRAAARDRLAAAGILRVPIELERRGVSDRAGDRISGRRVDLVRRGERQRRLLRRRTNARRPSRLSDPQGRYSGRDAVGVRRALHGPRQGHSRCWSWPK